MLKSPEKRADRTKLLMQADTLLTPPSVVTLPETTIAEQEYNIRPVHGKIELTIRGTPSQTLTPGDRLMVRATVSRPTGYNSPGSFNYKNFLAHKSIWVTGWIKSPAHILALEKTDFSTKIRYLPEQARNNINIFLDNHLPAGTSGLYKAILTGDRAGIPSDTLENFKAAGILHLLAISGLHMGLIAFGIGTATNWLTRRSSWLLLHTPAWKLAALVSIPLLTGYALIAGFQTPVVRSLIMTLVFLLAILFDRQWHIPTNIALAALLILLLQPESLFTASFQLSFAAVITIAAVLPQITLLTITTKEPGNSLQRSATKFLFAVKNGFLLSLAAQAGTLPLLLFYFNRFSTVSAFSTLVTEPLLCLWSLTLGLISAPFIFIAPGTADFILQLGAQGIILARMFTDWIAGFSFCSVWLPTPTILEISLYYIFLFSLLCGIKKRRFQIAAVFSLIFLLLIPAYRSYRINHSHSDTISFLDVGQGNGAVVELAGGYRTIIDGGGAYSPRFNVGEGVIAPFLWSKGIRRIDSVIISHPDADHFNGLAFILERFHPEKLWINGDIRKNKKYTELLALAEQQGIKIDVPSEGEILFKNDRSQIINTAALHLTRDTPSPNDKSLVIKLSTQGTNFVFTGDISEFSEKELVNSKEDIKAEVLLLSHHGSNSSSSEKFLAAVKPCVVVISAGKHAKNSFPSPEILERCRKKGYRIFNTAEHGTVSFRVENGTVESETTIHQ